MMLSAAPVASVPAPMIMVASCSIRGMDLSEGGRGAVRISEGMVLCGVWAPVVVWVIWDIRSCLRRYLLVAFLFIWGVAAVVGKGKGGGREGVRKRGKGAYFFHIQRVENGGG